MGIRSWELETASSTGVKMHEASRSYPCDTRACCYGVLCPVYGLLTYRDKSTVSMYVGTRRKSKDGHQDIQSFLQFSKKYRWAHHDQFWSKLHRDNIKKVNTKQQQAVKVEVTQLPGDNTARTPSTNYIGTRENNSDFTSKENFNMKFNINFNDNFTNFTNRI
jgi:hypothetical protein